MSGTLTISLDGYTDLPPGKIANVVTFVEMTAPPPAAAPLPAGLAVVRVEHPTAAWYRGLYTRIGQRWLWFSRAVMSDTALSALLASPAPSCTCCGATARISEWRNWTGPNPGPWKS